MLDIPTAPTDIVSMANVQPDPGYGINREDLDLVSRTVLRLGGYAEGLFDFHHFGFDKSILRNHITSIHSMLSRLKDTGAQSPISLRPPNMPSDALFEDQGDTWNYLQTLRLAAGATMMSEKYHPHMNPENLQKAMTAKILHECQFGILDDLIDKGAYSYLEAKDLYHLVFSSMIDPDFDTTSYMKRLIAMLKQEQVPLFDLINSITRGFNVLWNNSPHGDDYFYQMEVLNDRVALGQALTMFQKERGLSITKMDRIGTAFYAPRDDLLWWEKIGAHIAGAARYNFIDMAFSGQLYDLRNMGNFMSGWYLYDASIILMDHVASIYKDLRNGIANLSLIAMREKELAQLTSLKGYNPQLTIDDFEAHLRRIAWLSAHGLRLVDRDFRDETLYYPFITIMMPVVMMADWIGNRDDMIHTFLEAIAPTIREVASGEQPTAAPFADIAEEIARGA